MTKAAFMAFVKNQEKAGNELVVYFAAETLWKNILCVGSGSEWKAYENSRPFHILGCLGGNRFRTCLYSDLPAELGRIQMPEGDFTFLLHLHLLRTVAFCSCMQ